MTIKFSAKYYHNDDYHPFITTHFNALIKPIMLYGSCTWCTASEEYVNRVSKLQKRAARVILDADIGERSELLFRQQDWLPLKEELNVKRSSLIFRRIKDENVCPSYIAELLTRNSDRHTRASRYGKYNLVCPSYNRETEGGANFPSQWNETVEQHPFRHSQERLHSLF